MSLPAAMPLLGAAAGSLRFRRRGGDSVDAALDRFAAAVVAPFDLDVALAAALDAMAALLPAQSYFAYAAKRPGDLPRLRATRTASGAPPRVGPGYAGLVGGPVARQAPLEFRLEGALDAVALDGTEAEPFVSLACGATVALRAAVAPDRGVGGAVQADLRRLSRRIRPALAAIALADALRVTAEQATLVGLASRQVMQLPMRVDRLLDLACGIAARSLDVQSGCLVVWPGEGVGEAEILWRHGDADGLYAALDPRAVHGQVRPLRTAVWVAPGLPPSLASLGLAAYVFIPIDAAPAYLGALVMGALRPPSLSGEAARLAETTGAAASQALRARALSESQGTAYLEQLLAVSRLLDSSDPLGVHHSEQVAALAERLAAGLGLSAGEVAAIRLAGRLHDVGMIATRLELPAVSGRLSDAERELVRQHPSLGADLLAGLPTTLVPAETVAAVRHHHERWVGGGYPEGLAGQAIPLPARILACAELLVGRLSARSYRPGLPIGQALWELQQAAGQDLDPEMVAELLRIYASAGVRPDPAPGDDGPIT